MQIKITMHILEWSKLKRMKNPGGGTDVEQPELSYTAGRKTMESYLPFPAKYETYT